MYSRSILSVTLAGALAACGPSPRPTTPVPRAEVPSQPDGRLIRVGESVTDVIGEEDPSWGTNGPFHLYRFDARRGDRLAIEMRSDEFDTYLVVGDRAGGIFSPIAQDDDSGGDLDARVRFVVPATGTYWVLAQAYSDYATGAYTLSLDPLPEPRPVSAQTIAPGSSVLGELSEEDAQNLDDESYFDLYTFPAEGGERYAITMNSPGFDTYLVVGTGTTDFAEMARDDDSGGGTDSRLIFAPERSGTYSIRATSFGGGTTGEYSLSITRMPPPGPVSVVPVTMGRSLVGMLEEGDAMSDDGSFFDLYSFRGTEGQRLRITMRSSDFDSYLELGETDADDFLGEYSDDDSGGDLDAQIIATLQRTGTYHLRANSLYANETGSYTLIVEELPPPGPATVRPIGVGQTLSGTLEPSDGVMDDESYYDVYTFRGSAQQRVRITLRSEAFDAFLSFGPWRNDRVEVIESDDDSAGGLDAMIEVTLPAAGTYGIQANSLGAGELGDYTITVETTVGGRP